MGKFRDLTGQRFGRLVVCRRTPEPGSSRGVSWICKCDCGRGKVVLGYNLTKGKTKSCGCIRSEIGRETIKKYGNKQGRMPKRTVTQS